MARKTTGDRIRDFVIVAHGAPNPDQEKIYWELQEKISQHAGEFVLLVGRSYEFHGCTGFGHVPELREYNLETHICLGILNGKELVFGLKNHPQCEIPTSKYARPWGGVREEIKVEKENIKDSTMGVLGLYWSILELGKPAKIVKQFGRSVDPPINSMDAFNGWKPEQNPKLEIKIGDVEVDEWFKANKRHEKTYEKMQKALGRIAMETPEIKEKQQTILKKLAELTQEKLRLLNKVRDALELKKHSQDENGIVTITIPSPQGFPFESFVARLHDLEEQIQKEVSAAIELGLENVKSIKNLLKNTK